MSTDTLTWLLTKKNSSFLVKRCRNEFSREKFNLMNQNCRKYSGFAAVKGVDLSLADKKVTLTTKIGKFSKKPSKQNCVTPLNKGFRSVCKTVKANSVNNFYRADLKKAALARWSLLNRVAKVEKGLCKKSVIRTKRNVRA